MIEGMETSEEERAAFNEWCRFTVWTDPETALWLLGLLRDFARLEEALREAKNANVDLAINAVRRRAKALNILRTASQRAQSTDGNEADVTATYRDVDAAIAALSPRDKPE